MQLGCWFYAIRSVWGSVGHASRWILAQDITHSPWQFIVLMLSTTAEIACQGKDKESGLVSGRHIYLGADCTRMRETDSPSASLSIGFR
jgi:hypothetical protein